MLGANLRVDVVRRNVVVTYFNVTFFSLILFPRYDLNDYLLPRFLVHGLHFADS